MIPLDGARDLFLSIIVPFLNEEGNVQASIESITEGLKGFDFRYEIVCVDNGSTDDTYAELLREQEKFPEIKIITMPLNFGFGAGLLLGFVAAKGVNVGYVWGDHQIPQQTITDCMTAFLKHPGTVVKGARISRAESL